MSLSYIKKTARLATIAIAAVSIQATSLFGMEENLPQIEEATTITPVLTKLNAIDLKDMVKTTNAGTANTYSLNNDTPDGAQATWGEIHGTVSTKAILAPLFWAKVVGSLILSYASVAFNHVDKINAATNLTDALNTFIKEALTKIGCTEHDGEYSINEYNFSLAGLGANTIVTQTAKMLTDARTVLKTTLDQATASGLATAFFDLTIPGITGTPKVEDYVKQVLKNIELAVAEYLNGTFSLALTGAAQNGKTQTGTATGTATATVTGINTIKTSLTGRRLR